jgi:hypothetical protein
MSSAAQAAQVAFLLAVLESLASEGKLVSADTVLCLQQVLARLLQCPQLHELASCTLQALLASSSTLLPQLSSSQAGPAPAPSPASHTMTTAVLPAAPSSSTPVASDNDSVWPQRSQAPGKLISALLATFAALQQAAGGAAAPSLALQAVQAAQQLISTDGFHCLARMCPALLEGPVRALLSAALASPEPQLRLQGLHAAAALLQRCTQQQHSTQSSLSPTAHAQQQAPPHSSRPQPVPRGRPGQVYTLPLHAQPRKEPPPQAQPQPQQPQHHEPAVLPAGLLQALVAATAELMCDMDQEVAAAALPVFCSLSTSALLLITATAPHWACEPPWQQTLAMQQVARLVKPPQLARMFEQLFQTSTGLLIKRKADDEHSLTLETALARLALSLQPAEQQQLQTPQAASGPGAAAAGVAAGDVTAVEPPVPLQPEELSSSAALCWLAVQEAARQVVASRLRTHLGGPTHTLGVLDKLLQHVHSRLPRPGVKASPVQVG